MDREAAINLGKTYKSLVMQHFDVKDVILYGSYGKGTQRQDSDIDIAVVVNTVEGDYFDYVPLLWKLRRQVSSLIEPVLIWGENDRSGFLKDIRQTGIVL
jgi:predicted nucleotidyltransferase